MQELIGHEGDLVWVAAKAALLVATAVIGFRLVGRRTLAEMTGYDFVAAVAVGAIVGRVPNASTTSYLQGATTLVTIFAVHVLLTRLRLTRGIHRVIEHRPEVVVRDGSVDEAMLRRCGFTEEDLHGMLRANGVAHLDDVALAVVESHGDLSVLRTRSAGGDADEARTAPRLWQVARLGS